MGVFFALIVSLFGSFNFYFVSLSSIISLFCFVVVVAVVIVFCLFMYSFS